LAELKDLIAVDFSFSFRFFDLLLSVCVFFFIIRKQITEKKKKNSYSNRAGERENVSQFLFHFIPRYSDFELLRFHFHHRDLLHHQAYRIYLIIEAERRIFNKKQTNISIKRTRLESSSFLSVRREITLIKTTKLKKSISKSRNYFVG